MYRGYSTGEMKSNLVFYILIVSVIKSIITYLRTGGQEGFFSSSLYCTDASTNGP